HSLCRRSDTGPISRPFRTRFIGRNFAVPSARVVDSERFVRLELDVAREGVALVGVLAARQDPHQRVAAAAELVDQPEHVGLGLAPRAAVGALDRAQPPLHLRALAQRRALAETVGTHLQAAVRGDLAGPVAREARTGLLDSLRHGGWPKDSPGDGRGGGDDERPERSDVFVGTAPVARLRWWGASHRAGRECPSFSRPRPRPKTSSGTARSPSLPKRWAPWTSGPGWSAPSGARARRSSPCGRSSWGTSSASSSRARTCTSA